jgi:hypothetical protein
MSVDSPYDYGMERWDAAWRRGTNGLYDPGPYQPDLHGLDDDDLDDAEDNE